MKSLIKIHQLTGLTYDFLKIFFFRNESRLPLSPSFMGKIMQCLMVLTLFFPKIMMVSMSLVHAPYSYPITLLLEYALVVSYNWIAFKSSYCEC